MIRAGIREGSQVQNRFTQKFDQLISDHHHEQALDDLNGYFSRTQKPFTGAHFHLLGVNEPNRITCDDLCAVNLLGVSFNSYMIFELTSEPLQSTATRLLKDIPDNKDIWEVSDFLASDELWKNLRDITGVGPTIAGKILARKRPRLIPIYDSLVGALLGAPDGKYWASFQETLQDHRRIDALTALRREAGISEEVSILRVFDVIAWMEGKRCQAQ